MHVLANYKDVLLARPQKSEKIEGDTFSFSWDGVVRSKVVVVMVLVLLLFFCGGCGGYGGAGGGGGGGVGGGGGEGVLPGKGCMCCPTTRMCSKQGLSKEER